MSTWFPNSVWEPCPGNSVSRGRVAAKQSFADGVPKRSLGTRNEPCSQENSAYERTTYTNWDGRLGFVLLPLIAVAGQSTKPADKNQTFKGRVVPLDKLLAKQDIKLDPDAVAASLVLQTDDGKVYLLVKDAGARMVFQDVRLLNRPMRLTGRLVAGGGLLQVVSVQSYVKGQLCDVYYWCDICTIRSQEFGACACCGGKTELREVPLKE